MNDPWGECLDKIADRGWCKHHRHMGRGILLSELETDPPDRGWMPSKRQMIGLSALPSDKPDAS